MRQRLRAARQDESGFTLIELLIVIVILGVLAGVVVFAVSGITDRGVTAACKADHEDRSGRRRGVLRQEHPPTPTRPSTRPHSTAGLTPPLEPTDRLHATSESTSSR